MQSESRVCARYSAEPQRPGEVSRPDTPGIVIKAVSTQYWHRGERAWAKDLDITAEVGRKRQRQYALRTIDMEGGWPLQDSDEDISKYINSVLLCDSREKAYLIPKEKVRKPIKFSISF